MKNMLEIVMAMNLALLPAPAGTKILMPKLKYKAQKKVFLSKRNEACIQHALQMMQNTKTIGSTKDKNPAPQLLFPS